MIRHVLFDLDYTLYSVRSGLEENVDRLLGEYLSGFLGISADEAMAERSRCVVKYGTTLEWLMAEKNFSAVDEYLHYVHPENEADDLSPDPELRRFLENLPCPCSVLTNSPSFHADRVIKKLGLEGVFKFVFDIESNDYKGKPSASAFFRALDAVRTKPDETLFIDDYPRYVKGFIDIGGKGILIDERNKHLNYPNEKIKSLFELTRFF